MKNQSTSPTKCLIAQSGVLRKGSRRLATCCVTATLGFFGNGAVHADLSHYQAATTNEPSLISYYSFDQGDAPDLKGNNHGTLVGSPGFITGINNSGLALSLNGTNWVNLGVVEDFAFADDETGTVEAWIKAGNLTGAGCIFANRDGLSRWDIHMDQNKLGIGMWNGGTYFPVVAIPNASTNWHHLAVVFADAFFTVYWDGVAVGTLSRPLGFTDFTKSTQIGSVSPYFSNQENWVGQIDEVAIYADALTPEAIAAHYEAIFVGNPPVITRQPQGGTFVAGAAPTLSVTATGPGLHYQWFKGANPLPDQTNTTLSFPSLTTDDAGTYTVQVSNTAAVVTSSDAVIALAALPAKLTSYQAAVANEPSLISYYPFDRLLPEDVKGPNEGTLAGTAGWDVGIGGGAARGLWLDGGGHVDLGSVADFDFASGVGTVEGWFRADWTSLANNATIVANRNDGPTVWGLYLNPGKSQPIVYNGAVSALYVLSPDAATNWHHFAVVFTDNTASVYVDGNLLPFSPLAFTFGAGPGTVQIGSSRANTTFRSWVGMLDEIAFYSSALPASSIQAHYNAFVAGEPPVINAQPTGGYYLVGQSGLLSVAATGAQLTYQWYKDGTPIPGATNPVVGPVVLSTAHAGDYFAIITNLSGSVTSEVASIFVGNDITSYQAAVLSESSLISFYTFDNGDPQDAKGAHPGTVANTVAYGTGPGGVTNAALVLAGDGHIDLGQVPDFDFVDGSGTIEGWIQPDWLNPAPYDPCLFADRDGGSVWSVHNSRWKNEIGNFSSGYTALPIFSDNGWHHYAIVFNAGTVAMYWDGQPRGSYNQTINSGLARSTQIGSSAPGVTSEGWLGSLDEIAFYSDALSAGQIWNHFTAMIVPATPTLAYELNGTQLTLSWPASVTGYTLESSDTLPGTTWNPVPGVVNNSVTVDASVGIQFFRLKK